MSIRSTNVWVMKKKLRNLPHSCPIDKSSYEERSLGVFESPPDDKDAEPDDIPKLPSRRERVGRYLGWHLRRQMSIGMSFVFPLQKFPFRLRIFIYLFYYHYVQIFGGSYGLCSSLPSLNGRTFWMNPWSGSIFFVFYLNSYLLLEVSGSVLVSHRYGRDEWHPYLFVLFFWQQ